MFLILFLLNTQDNITAAFDRNKYSLGILIEITKAIDTVNHENYINSKPWQSEYRPNRSCFEMIPKLFVKPMLTCCCVLDVFFCQAYQAWNSIGIYHSCPLLFLFFFINELSSALGLLNFLFFADDLVFLVATYSIFLNVIPTL